MTTLQISLLGPLTVTINDHPAAFRTDAERALLAYLAMRQGVPQRRDTLAGLLSPERNDSAALTYLRNRLTRLRAALGDDAAALPWFVADRKQIALRAGNDGQPALGRDVQKGADMAQLDRRMHNPVIIHIGPFCIIQSQLVMASYPQGRQPCKF